MVSKFGLLYSVYSNPGLSVNELVKKLGKKQVSYQYCYNLLKGLEAEKLIKFREKSVFLGYSGKTKDLLKLIDFCVRNQIDYDELFLPKTIEFVELGLRQTVLEDLPFDNKTVARISRLLSRHGFLVVDSRKPFSARLVCSDFLVKLVEFFQGKVAVKCKPVFEGVDETRIDAQIEREFSIYKKHEKKKIVIEDEIKFIHRSLSLEGNTLTLPETEKLIQKNIPAKSKSFKDMQEVVDYKKAVDWLIASADSLNLNIVLEFHSKAMASMQFGAGHVRKQNVVIKGNPNFKTPDWKEVPNRLSEFFNEYHKKEAEKMKAHDAVGFAASLHLEFQRVHPFIDGNSRTSRAIFIHTLLKKGFPLVTFPVGFTDQYMALTKLSKKRDDKNFELLMKQIVLHSLKQTNKKMKYS